MTEFGALRSSEEIATAIEGARAWRVEYASADLHDVPTVASGLVIAPSAAGADLPIMTWCHGTTGLGDAACPSAQPDPARELVVYFSAEATQQIDYGVPGLQRMVDAGWVVCATDYQGLGTDGVHQYTVNRTNARDAVAIAHAARALDVGAGTELGCMGWSQGGGTAAAVAELDAADFGDLRLLGTVPMSPGVPSVVFTGSEAAGAIFDPKAPIDPHVVMVLYAFARAFPALDLGDVLTPLGSGIVDAAWSNQPVHHLGDTLNRLHRLQGPILRPDPQNLAAWVQAFAEASAGREQPLAPVLMCVDAFDGGTVVPVAWQEAYRRAVEAHGGDVTVREYPDDDHFSLPASCVADALAWLESLRS